MEDTPEMNKMILDCVQQERDDVISRKRFFTILCFVEVLLNLDSGLVPACLDQINKELHMDEEEVGYCMPPLQIYVYSHCVTRIHL